MAGEYIEFNNNSQPAINDTNLNRLQQLIRQDIQGAVSGDTLPIGAIMPFGSDTIPDNWLLCNGQAVSRTDYQELFNTIGTTYGTGDGFTTFNLPDLKGKIPVGKNANDTDFETLGETGGEKTHTLTVNEMPKHTHGTGLVTGALSQATYRMLSDNNYDGTSTTHEVGGGQPHNILQPYIVQNYIIKAKQSAGVTATVVDNLTSTSATNALSANQGRVLNEKFSRNIITAYPTQQIISITGRSQVIPLDGSEIVGNKLTLVNNKIKIGSNVSTIKISASVFYQDYDTSVAYLFPEIRKNQNKIARAISSRMADVTRYQSVAIPEFIISVEENDLIDLTAGEINSTQEGSIRGNLEGTLNTYITVEVVE